MSGGQFGWLGVWALVALVGCDSNPPTHPVKGRVVFADGTPVQFGDIETLAVGQRINARGKIQKDGSFSLTTYQEGDGAVAGEHQVIIMQSVAAPLIANAKVGPIKHTHGHDIGAKYRSYASSGLSFTVEAGAANEVTLVIEEFTKGESGPAGH
jgi:hypothetical protein